MSTSALSREHLQQVFAEADCLADEATVERAIARVATDITRDLGDKLPVLLCVVKGGIVFGGKLLTCLHFPLDFDYVHATRYNNTTEGSGLTWKVPPSMPLAGRHVLVVDDILDVGATLDAIVAACRQQGAASVHTAVLVDKRHDRKARPGMRADYTGLEIADRYLFGYGMDYQGYWRNAPGIYAVKGL
ncbi:MAG: hypoxanthine-guanine phosphoribosyltransferase [Pseudomonadota bacterium]